MGISRRRAAMLSLAFLTGPLVLPSGLTAAPEDPTPLGPADREELARYARATWRSLDEMTWPVGLPADHLCRDSEGTWTRSPRTSPTDIAAYLWSILAAEDLGIIDPAAARDRLEKTLGALAKLERDRGFFLNKYDPRTGERLKVWPQTGKPVRTFVSTVDNGWIAASLIMIRNTRPSLRARAEKLLEPIDFGIFLDPYDPADPTKHTGQLHGGYWPDDRSFTTCYGMLNTEPRIASYIGIARGQIPPEHYFRLFRTPPTGQVDQQQVPAGESRTYLGVPVYEGHYTYRGMRIVPSWGGSMFEALMVPLFVPEARWAPRSWGINHPLYVRAQIEHGLDDARYGYWGFSPAEKPGGGYRTYGVDAIGAFRDGYTSNEDDTQFNPDRPPPPAAYTNGVVTPHASFLALSFAPREALANLESIAAKFPAYGPHGFHDSVNVSSGKVSECVLALDQGMIMAAIANALADGAMQRAFTEGEIEAAVRTLIAPEEFTAGPLLSAT
jgi:hypothetical protein